MPGLRLPRLIAALLLALAAAGAAAQLRSIPLDAKRGTMRHLQEMIVRIDGKPRRLAAGAQIRDPQNRLVLPVALPPDVLVKFTVDTEGNVARVWMLTPQEAAAPDPRD